MPDAQQSTDVAPGRRGHQRPALHRHRITADGRDGYRVEPGRYRLVVSRACPWASRTVIVRRLLGLENALPMAIAGPTHDRRSWTFDLDPGGRHPVLGIRRLQEAYFKRIPGYGRGITVPAIVDMPTGEVVIDDHQQLTIDLSLWAYARDLFQTPGFGDTVDFDPIKRHYYAVHRDINPTGIVPLGPDLSNWLEPHGREALGGRPFGDGTPRGPGERHLRS
jgi:glutathionyl-hydroquinone reductase